MDRPEGCPGFGEWLASSLAAKQNNFMRPSPSLRDVGSCSQIRSPESQKNI